MQLNNIMNLFSDMLIIIKDDEGRVVYPSDSQLIEYANQLRPLSTDNPSELINPNTNRIYKSLTSPYVENNKRYHLTRYIEITEYKRRERELQTDETTGLNIKKAAYKEFNNYIKQAIEKGEEFSAIISDADFFKRVNDTYGHLAGDYILRYIADTIISQTRHGDSRPKDIVGRIGGEEYLIVLKDIPAIVTLDRMNSIRERIASSPIVFEGKPISITCSFGVVHVSSNQIKKVRVEEEKIDSFRAQVQHSADLALYQAKESGRNNVQMKKFSM